VSSTICRIPLLLLLVFTLLPLSVFTLLPLSVFTPAKAVQLFFQRDTTLVLNGDSVDLLFPRIHPVGEILVLPGWNFSRKKCCASSSFCSTALSKGYILILPEMGKSVYASRLYPETRKDWIRYPELPWVLDTLFGTLQKKFGLLKPGQNNYIFGISTGGRGVALIMENSLTLFKAGAALSGDYDQTLFPGDNLMKGVYGEFGSFRSRWEGADNPARNAVKITVPLYLGHGENDKIVPCGQSKLFFEALNSTKNPEKFKLHLSEKHGHDYAYWDSETSAVLDFFVRNR